MQFNRFRGNRNDRPYSVGAPEVHMLCKLTTGGWKNPLTGAEAGAKIQLNFIRNQGVYGI